MKKNNLFQCLFILLFAFFAHTAPESDVPKDYYKILGVSKNASQKEITTAYLRLAMKHHPDRHEDKSEEIQREQQKIFTEIAAASEVLRDPNTRAMYDMGGHAAAASAPKNPPDIHLKKSRLASYQLKLAENPYKALGLDSSVDQRRIKQAYESARDKIEKDILKEMRTLGRQSRGLNPEKISALSRIYSAYRVLSNPEWRDQYDFNRERSIEMEGRLFTFEDRANEKIREFFHSEKGEVFELLKGELVRDTIFTPPENKTSFRTVLKVFGERFTLQIFSGAEMEESRAISAELQLQQRHRHLEDFKKRLNNKWSRLKSASQDRIKNVFPKRFSSKAAQTLPADMSQWDPSRLTWEELHRMIHPYSENSIGSLKTSLKRIPGETLTFFAAIGAFSYLKTGFDFLQYDGMQTDPQWEQTLASQLASPIGVFSFACFVVAAGQMNRLLEVGINQLITGRYNQKKSRINSGIASKGDVTDEHRKAASKN